MDVLKIIIGVVALAALGEGIVEFFVAPLLDLAKGKLNDTLRQQAQRMCSAGVGVAIAFNYSLGVGMILEMPARWSAVDTVLMGLLIGRGSNAVHEWIERFATENRFNKQALNKGG